MEPQDYGTAAKGLTGSYQGDVGGGSRKNPLRLHR